MTSKKWQQKWIAKEQAPPTPWILPMRITSVFLPLTQAITPQMKEGIPTAPQQPHPRFLVCTFHGPFQKCLSYRTSDHRKVTIGLSWGQCWALAPSMFPPSVSSWSPSPGYPFYYQFLCTVSRIISPLRFYARHCLPSSQLWLSKLASGIPKYRLNSIPVRQQIGSVHLTLPEGTGTGG